MRREHNVNPSHTSSSRYSNSVRRTQVQCELCHSWLSNRYALKAHMLRHTSEPKKCPQCDKISPNANALSSHIREVHADRIHKCHLCEKSFKAAVALKVSLNIFDEQNRVKFAGNNPEHFRELEEIRMNFDTFRINQKIKKFKKMPGNSKKLQNPKKNTHFSFQDHVATHTREKSYRCTYCPEEFIWRSNMYAHQKKCHPMEWSEDRKRKSPFSPES